MSLVEFLREFVTERLTAAAEEIFRVFKRTIVEYEAEIDRQRKLLDIVWKPHVNLQRIELPVQHVKRDGDEKADEHDGQQLCNQESISCLDKEPAEIKQEPKELCISQEGGQLLMEHEAHTLMLLRVNEGSEISKTQLEINQQLHSSNSGVAENQDPKGGL